MSNIKSDIKSSPESKESERSVHYLDANGNSNYITPRQMREEIIPHNFTKAWETPDSLIFFIDEFMKDGFFEECEPAAKRALELTNNTSRAVCVYAKLLNNLGRFAETEELILNHITNNSSLKSEQDCFEFLYANLGAAQFSLGKRALALETLDEILKVNPNSDIAIGTWLEFKRGILKSEGVKEFYLAALDEAYKRYNSWRVMFWYGQYYANLGNREQCLHWFEKVLASEYTQDILAPISGHLGQSGFCEDLVRLIAPRYVVGVHSEETAFNLIQGYIKLKRFKEATALITELSKTDISAPVQYQLTQFEKLIKRKQRWGWIFG